MATAKKIPSGSWRCLVYSHTESKVDKDGKQTKKRIYESFTSDDPSPAGKREAEFMASEFAMNKKNIALNISMTVNDAIQAYLKVKGSVLSQTTLKAYTSMSRSLFYDINDIKLNKLTSPIVQSWINGLSAAKKSPKTIRNANGLLSAVIEIYSPGLSYKVTLPQKIKPNLYVPSDSDVKVLLNYYSETDKDMYLAILLAAFGTLRRSEICALTAADVSGNRISVNKAMVKAVNNEWIIKTTKTVSSTRTIDMPQFVIESLPKEGRLLSIYPSNITDRFTHAFEKLNISKFRFHDLRHYAASIMHAIGIPDVYIMQRGGWASDNTLKQVYRGSIEDYQKKYNEQTIDHFKTFNMQHGMQHEIKKD